MNLIGRPTSPFNGFGGQFSRSSDALRYAMQRYFRTSNGSDTSAALAAAETLQAGDTVEISFVSSAPKTVQEFFTDGATDSGRGFIIANSTNKLAWNGAVFSGAAIDGVAATSGVTVLPSDGKPHILSGVALADGVIGAVGAKYDATAGFFTGELFDLKLTQSGVTTNYAMSSDSLVYEQAVGYGLGSEEVVNGTNLVDTVGWTSGNSAILAAAGGELVVTNGGTAFGYAYQAITTVVGEAYLFSVNVDYTGDSGHISVGTTAGGQDYGVIGPITTDGVREIAFTATTTTAYVRVGLANNAIGHTCSFVTTSLKAAPKSLIYSNFVAGDIDLYTWDAVNVRWEGVELLADGGFDGSCGVTWSCGTGWILATSKASCDGSQISFTALGTVPSINTTVGARYLVADVAEGISAGKYRPWAGAWRDTNGSNSAVEGATSTNFFYQGDVPFVGSLLSSSVKRVLELS